MSHATLKSTKRPFLFAIHSHHWGNKLQKSKISSNYPQYTNFNQIFQYTVSLVQPTTHGKILSVKVQVIALRCLRRLFPSWCHCKRCAHYIHPVLLFGMMTMAGFSVAWLKYHIKHNFLDYMHQNNAEDNWLLFMFTFWTIPSLSKHGGFTLVKGVPK